MSSSVFFKFKSSKEPQRITFDGTGISVFELKKEIINISGLGDGTDFDLAIYHEDTNEEYDDDTALIPRSTSVVARRLPAARPGQGKAARYVSGKAPIRNHRRAEQQSQLKQNSNAGANQRPTVSNTEMSEEERIAAMFEQSGEQWAEQQRQMASAAPVHRAKAVSNRPLPPNYICHRCNNKGHWIQDCPTNDDPNFRLRRTTGIPRSMLRKIDAPTAPTNDGLTDEKKRSGVMKDGDDYYEFVPDEASWQRYQAKAQTAATQQDGAGSGDKELQKRGLECPIDKRIFVDPMKTPCCGTTYCNDCIENALVNSDLVCPNCSKEGVLLDDLVPDEDMIKRIQAYEQDKASALKKEQLETDSVKTDSAASGSVPKPPSPKPSSRLSNKPAEKNQKNDAEAKAKKRGVNEFLGFDQAFVTQMNALVPPMAPHGIPQSISQQFWPQQYGPPPMYGSGWGMPGMPGMMATGGIPNGLYGQQGWQGNPGWEMNGMPAGVFPNQQPGPNQTDNAYFRQPVNPHRHQRQKRPRPSDYKEL